MSPMFSRLRCENCGSTFASDPPAPHDCKDGPKHYATPKPSAQSDALKRAIESLSAVEVAPGRYAYPTRGPWMSARETDVLRAAIEPDTGLDSLAVVMPSWWTPEQRFAWRVIDDQGFDYGVFTTKRRPKGGDCTPPVNRLAPHWIMPITADLETGEEVPA